MTNPLLIAIDGPSASGKGSLADKIAQHYNIPHLNTGALYRGVAWRMIKRQISLTEFLQKSDENPEFLAKLTDNIAEDDLENSELFTEKTGEIASKIAQNQNLRNNLIKAQHDFISNNIAKFNGVVLDGRDIASKIMPQAQFKFYVTADVEQRAKRRFLQLQEKGENVDYQEILNQLKQRDENDKNRKNSPLTIDESAIIIDNTKLTAKETFVKAIAVIDEKYQR